MKSAEEKTMAGGLLANVSLLTTGGSSLQHLTNNGLQLTSDKSSASGNVQENHKATSKKTDDPISTSTPARSAFSNNIVYGFDLSPVHSYEMPVAALTSKRSIDKSKSQEELDFQRRLEEHLFSESNSAPNFMQAPSVASSHQSKLSIRQSDDTETMMSQVYSQQFDAKFGKHSSSSLKKSSKGVKSNLRSPSHVTPRKASKRYSNVQGSGYGLTSPWKSPIKSKIDQKQKPANAKPAAKKKSKSKQEKRDVSPKSDRITDDTLALLANIKENKSAKTDQQLERVAGSTYNVHANARLKGTRNVKDILKEMTNIGDDQPEAEAAVHLEQSDEFKTLQDRYKALEEECLELKAGKDEMNKENFLLTAKLNKLVTVNESTDPMTKDSLNEDPRDAEIGRLKKEVVEQDRILSGYQQENEKLYGEVSRLKVVQRETENAMYAENLKLKGKVASLKEELESKDAVIKDKNHLLHDKEETRTSKTNVSVQTEETSELLLTKMDIEKDKEIADLKARLSECVENGAELKDREVRLKKSNGELAELQQQVISLKRELTTKKTNSKKRESDMVEELQRQVKQLEAELVKTRKADHVKDVLYGDKEKTLLEERCQQLEKRLHAQEEQFSSNMSSLHQLYKNMSKDYEERVEKLSEHLQQLKKKRHRDVDRDGQCTDVQHKLLSDENLLLIDQIQSLKQELFDERKPQVARSSPSKGKKKARNKNDPTYNPDYFVQHSPGKSAPQPATVARDSSKQIQELTSERESLMSELRRWKAMYDDVKTSQDNVKASKESEIEKLVAAHKQVLSDLESSNVLLRERLNNVELELSKSRSGLLSSSAREEALQFQIRNLLDELQDTRRASPVAAFRHLDSLQAQIRMLNFRQKTREDKLDRVVASSADEYLKAEIRSLHNTIAEKNVLISKFQCELDAILRALEAIQNSKKSN